MRLFLLLTALFVTTFSLTAQVNFNHYTTIQSIGPIPSDFSDQTSQKIEEGMSERRTEIGTELEQREFLENTEYAIDELLHSGLVVYGDEVSNYVSSIADKLLEGNPELRSKLRFYTLKLNATNAFSTDQGIIFVTTGLISQLTSEAQLAYILAHEISHYTEKHVVETFAWKKNNRYGSSWVNQMSVYSKDKEFSADNLAVDIYREAGYSKDELLSTFDVLLYSYLPFDEIPISLDYFASDKLFLPDFLFPPESYEIKADADEDDSQSSHPNVAKRKIAVKKRINEINKEWGSTLNSFGDDRFYELRNIARFETVRADVVEANYGKALYSIYLLEREFPSSVFLQRMKMHSWLGLYQYESHSKVSNTILSNKELEGESAPMHYFIRKLNRNSLTTLALRNIYDIHKLYPEDLELNAVYEYTLKLLAKDTRFSLDKYSKMSFSEYAHIVEINREMDKSDSVEVKDTLDEPPVKKSKYDRIKKNNSPDIIEESVDTLKYYYYGLSDLIKDPVFIEEYESYKLLETNAPPQETARRTQGSYRSGVYEELKIGSNNLIIVEPTVIDFSNQGVNLVKSDELETMFADVIVSTANETNTTIHAIDKRNLSTEKYNERSALINFLIQLVNDDAVKPFPINYTELQRISSKYGTPDVMFIMLDHTGKYMNRTNLTLLIVDAVSGELKFASTFPFKERVTKHNIGNRMYSLFKHINSIK